jgi:hypothetical protein
LLDRWFLLGSTFRSQIVRVVFVVGFVCDKSAVAREKSPQKQKKEKEKS